MFSLRGSFLFRSGDVKRALVLVAGINLILVGARKGTFVLVARINFISFGGRNEALILAAGLAVKLSVRFPSDLDVWSIWSRPPLNLHLFGAVRW